MGFTDFEWTNKNKYINAINSAPSNWIGKFKYKRDLIKRLKNTSPSFKDMVEMAEFLYYVDLIYLFENDADINRISGAVKSNLTQCIIIVKPNTTQTIKITLSGTDRIMIETTNNGKLRNKIVFNDGNAEVDNIHKERLFVTIIDSLMDAFSNVLLKYI